MNAYSTGDRWHGIFKDAARIDHSCVPNAHYAWNADLGCLTIHIVVDVFKHDEIMISSNDDLSYENRSKVLFEGYRFHCQCEACQTRTPLGDASVTRRKRMGEINNAMAEAETTGAEVESPPTDKGYLAKGLEMFELHLQEGGCHPRLAHAYCRISRCRIQKNFVGEPAGPEDHGS